MITVAFFNNKGGVGKTSLVYHLAWMLGELGNRVVAADLDPQANLSGMFLGDERLEKIWKKEKTINGDMDPLFVGKGDIASEASVENIGERIGLLTGDLALSSREDELSAQWPKCQDRDQRAFRVIATFARLIDKAGSQFRADLALLDVGPNLGAINRAALIACDHVVIPLAPDLFSLQGLRNVGPTLRRWRKEWQERKDKKPEELDIHIPEGTMEPLGYVIMRHSVRLDRPVKAYQRWIKKIPRQYREAVLDESDSESVTTDDDEHCLAHLKDYRSLMPLAQEANKPMFDLRPADGVMGAQQNAVRDCYEDFKSLAGKITDKVLPSE